jgi:hypothetical protein
MEINTDTNIIKTHNGKAIISSDYIRNIIFDFFKYQKFIDLGLFSIKNSSIKKYLIYRVNKNYDLGKDDRETYIRIKKEISLSPNITLKDISILKTCNGLTYGIFNDGKVLIIYNFKDASYYPSVRIDHVEDVTYMESYYDESSCKSFLLTKSSDVIKLWEFKKNKLVELLFEIKLNIEINTLCCLFIDETDLTIFTYEENVSNIINIYSNRKIIKTKNLTENLTYLDNIRAIKYIKSKDNNIFLISDLFIYVFDFEHLNNINTITHGYASNNIDYTFTLTSQNKFIFVDTNNITIIDLTNEKGEVKSKMIGNTYTIIEEFNSHSVVLSSPKGAIILYDIEKFKLIKAFNLNNKPIIKLKKFDHPMYGQCLIILDAEYKIYLYY